MIETQAKRTERSLKKRLGRIVARRLEIRRNARKFPSRTGRRVWLDVGAHLGEKTFDEAAADPDLLVFAFEPNLPVALRSAGRLPNYVVIPMAVSEDDGHASFFVNRTDVSSSLLPLDPEGVAAWVSSDPLEVEREVEVPTIRLDTFLTAAGIEHVDYLKIDAQGADLAVVRSAGDRLPAIDRIELEVTIADRSPYQGSAGKQETVDYLQAHGFALERAEQQSYGQEENLSFVRR